MGKEMNQQPPRRGSDPLAWSSGLMAALASCLLAPQLVSSLLPETSYRPSLAQAQEANEVSVDWVPYESPRISPRFVEANPEAPDNPPDETENFSFRDQQAAQPEAPLDESEAPKLEGDKPDTQKIIQSGEPAAPPPPLPALPSNSEAAKNFERGTPIGKEDQGKAKESPADLPEVDDPNGLTIRKVKEQGEDDASKRTIVLNQLPAPINAPPVTSAASPNTPKPRPRLRLAPDLVRGPLMTTETNAPRLGTVAVECRLHAYGAYVQEMLQAIEDQWHKLGHGSRAFLNRNNLPPSVKLRFKLDSNGRIHDLTKLDRYRPSLGSEICRQAIEAQAPYGKWTEEMIRDFGGEDEIKITFNYK
ncbi:MAG: hypothetical protein VB980_04835 [Opitutales bacterium]|jgi:hypothetical protein